MTDKLLKILSIKNVCWAAPSEWEGILDDGQIIVLHCEDGILSYGIGTVAKWDAWNDTVNHDEIELWNCDDFDDNFSMFVPLERLQEYTQHLFDWTDCKDDYHA